MTSHMLIFISFAITAFIVVAGIAWVTVLPSIGALYLLGWLP